MITTERIMLGSCRCRLRACRALLGLGGRGAPVPTLIILLPVAWIVTGREYASLLDYCYCCGCVGGFEGVLWSAGRAATCGMLGVCVTCPRSASPTRMPA